MVQWLFSMKYLDFGSIYLFSQINGMTPFDSIKGFQSGKDGLGAAPAIIYFNAESDKSQIFKDNKDKAGIYQWTHKESNKIYIGSAVDLSKRLKNYYSPYSLKQVDNCISRALLHHGHSAFCLSILEYIDIPNLSKEESKKLILSREQYYLDLIFLCSEDKTNTFNILPTAGSSLGYKHTEGTLASGARTRCSLLL
jgi:hypothetical protein